MKTVESVNFSGKRALVRVDFNVPLDQNFHVSDNTRIVAALPTLRKILNDGGSLVLMSHLGRPKGGPENKFSLNHIVKELGRQLGKEIAFATDCIGDEAFRKSAALKAGQVLLLENLRFHKEEEKGDEEFAKKLSGHGDIYVNDAFGTAHRAHASTAIIARFFPSDAKCFGYLMASEVENLDKVLHDAKKPFTAIIGGAKVSDKILIIERLLEKADNILIGGGMAFTFVKARGGKIGKSLCEDDKIKVAEELLAKAKVKGVNLFIPSDAVAAEKMSNEGPVRIVEVDAIPEGWMGLDIGERTITGFSQVIMQSKTILWNGPMGVFEMEAFEKGTRAIALKVAEATAMGAYTLVGGGDSVAAVNKYDLKDKVSYVSTGGGAMLEYIEQGTLPGVEAIA
jgi:phosphoglycerate kinase